MSTPSIDVLVDTKTDFQDLILSRAGEDLRLFLDGDLQFSSVDEHRYHEALVHPAMAVHPRPARVLLLGAGDGLALRDVLRWPDVASATLVDLDGQMVELCRTQPEIAALNAYAFDDPRVTVRIDDALRALPTLAAASFDVVIVDFPDAHIAPLDALYTTDALRAIRRVMAPGAVLSMQSSSPCFAPTYFASLHRTWRALDMQVVPHVADVPSFGEWGFLLVSAHTLDFSGARLDVPTRYLTQARLTHLPALLPGDIALTGGVVHTGGPALVDAWHAGTWDVYHQARR